ncbi:MAG TPA: hypothetical protein PK261_00655 [Accumulibacter sp.]|nr:hypothetical protein [Accumulibacter sp.]
MRIPPELIPPLPPTTVGKNADEPVAVGQVDAATANGDALSRARTANSPKSYQAVARSKGQTVAEEQAAAPLATEPPSGASPAMPTGAPVPYERRQGDRRQQNRPVLLDTRVSRGRRQASGDVGINIKV